MSTVSTSSILPCALFKRNAPVLLGWRKGWVLPAEADGNPAGATGESRRLEAVKVSLSGDMKAHYSVWYRVYIALSLGPSLRALGFAARAFYVGSP